MIPSSTLLTFIPFWISPYVDCTLKTSQIKRLVSRDAAYVFNKHIHLSFMKRQTFLIQKNRLKEIVNSFPIHLSCCKRCYLFPNSSSQDRSNPSWSQIKSSEININIDSSQYHSKSFIVIILIIFIIFIIITTMNIISIADCITDFAWLVRAPSLVSAVCQNM